MSSSPEYMSPEYIKNCVRWHLHMPEEKPKNRIRMIRYLEGHFNYPDTRGNDNYSQCMKTTYVEFDIKTLDSLYTMLKMPEPFDATKALKEFNKKYHKKYKIESVGTHNRHFALVCLDIDEYYKQKIHSVLQDLKTDEIQKRFDVVWDFDLVCEETILSSINFAQTHKVVEREVKVLRKVFVPR